MLIVNTNAHHRRSPIANPKIAKHPNRQAPRSPIHIAKHPSPHRSLKHFIGNRQSAIGVIVSLISSPAFSPDFPARSPAIPPLQSFLPPLQFLLVPRFTLCHFRISLCTCAGRIWEKPWHTSSPCELLVNFWTCGCGSHAELPQLQLLTHFQLPSLSSIIHLDHYHHSIAILRNVSSSRSYRIDRQSLKML